MTNNDRPGSPENTWGSGDDTWGSSDWAAGPTPPTPKQTEWGTQQFPAQQSPAWNQQPPVHQTQYQPQYQAAYPQPKPESRAPLLLIPLALVLLVGAGVAAFGWYQGWFGPVMGQPASAPQTVTSTYVVDPEEDAPAAAEPADARPATGSDREAPQLPAGARPVNGAGSSPAGSFENVYRGTEVTSEEFATVVAWEYRRNREFNGEPDQVVGAWSPVTGRTYEMTCDDNGSFVTCTGGNNAVVYLW